MKHQRLAGVVAPLVVLAAMAGAAPSALAQSLTLVGRAPGTAASRIYALSADGQSAAGYSQQESQANTLFPAFRWNASTGRQDFGVGLAPQYSLTLGYGISGDGATVVGMSKLVEGGDGTAFRWTQSGGYQSLGTLPGFTTSEARDASHDGSVIVGTCEQPGGGRAAFRWTQSGGMQSLGGGTTAEAISGNGTTVVGTFTNQPLAMYWTQASGMQLLNPLGGTGAADARAVNFDGSIIVGNSGPAFVATMWINAVPIELTNTIPNSRLTPMGVSDAGTVVAGVMSAEVGGQFAGVWTPETGIVRLDQYLVSRGVTLPAGINLGRATAVSSDGFTFAGYTDNGPYGVQGWVATVPAPSAAALLGLAGLMAARRRR